MNKTDADARHQRVDALYRRMRWQLPISFGGIIAALAVLAIQTKTWSWPLLSWGVVIGLVGAVYSAGCILAGLIVLAALSRRARARRR